MTDADVARVQRIKEILTSTWLGLEPEIRAYEVTDLCNFLDCTLLDKPCTCVAYPFPHKRGARCQNI
jgi:hypothetical protein